MRAHLAVGSAVRHGTSEREYETERDASTSCEVVVGTGRPASEVHSRTGYGYPLCSITAMSGFLGRTEDTSA